MDYKIRLVRYVYYFSLLGLLVIYLFPGSIIGCLYAGIIIGLVESLGGLLIDPSFKLLYVFAIYLLVVIYRPQGLFGRYYYEQIGYCKI